jgi:hypothetical protein
LERTTTSSPAPVIDPENYKGGTLRVPLGFSIVAKKLGLQQRELAHRHIKRVGLHDIDYRINF